VLSHQTGLANWGAGSRPRTLAFDPGERFSYSGEGYVYLQRVVEKLTGEPAERLFAQRLFEPLSMPSASLIWRDSFDETIAAGHTRRGDRGILRKMPEANVASSLVCTASDYGRFILSILRRPSASKTLLEQHSVEEMLAPAVLVREGISWGLGWGLQDDAGGVSFWHWGNNGGIYNAFVVASFEKGTACVIFTNSGYGLRLCRDVVPAVLGGEHRVFDWPMVVT